VEPKGGPAGNPPKIKRVKKVPLSLKGLRDATPTVGFVLAIWGLQGALVAYAVKQMNDAEKKIEEMARDDRKSVEALTDKIESAKDVWSGQLLEAERQWVTFGEKARQGKPALGEVPPAKGVRTH
jgi:hypothetical protein